IVAHYVNVENECGIRFRDEPVDIVLVIGNRGAFTRLEGAIDGRLDQIVIGIILDALVMPAQKIAAENDEPGTHVVVSVRDNGTALLHRENLPAENQPLRQAFYFA